jgi:hypothetical protein
MRRWEVEGCAVTPVHYEQTVREVEGFPGTLVLNEQTVREVEGCAGAPVHYEQTHRPGAVPFSSKSCTTRSVVTHPMRLPFGDLRPQS